MSLDHQQVFTMENEAFFSVVRERLALGDRVRIPVVGRSMEPFLRERDSVLLQVMEGHEPRVGDVLLARWNKAYVLHRLVWKKAGVWGLAGDNNLVQIEEIVPADLLAVVVGAERNGRQLPLATRLNKVLGLCWYYMRLPRRVLCKVMRWGGA